MANASESVGDEKADSSLPINRVRIIMKISADPSVPNIREEARHVVSRATEMLIKQLAKESIGTNKTLEYRHVADYVQSDNSLEFLHSILPKKITGKTFLKLLKEADDSDSSDESESSTSSSEEDESSSSSSSSSSSGSNKKDNEEEE